MSNFEYVLMMFEPLLWVAVISICAIGGAFVGDAIVVSAVSRVIGMLVGMFTAFFVCKLYIKLRYGPMPKRDEF